ncbi:DUF4160 domain-containing protein [Oxalobacteraceae bacterium A2-2]
MPTISVFYGIVIQMFFRDHLPPHFHIHYAGSKATFDIRKLILLEGRLPRRELRLVTAWAKLHQDELLENWRLCEYMQAPNPVPPLE